MWITVLHFRLNSFLVINNCVKIILFLMLPIILTNCKTMEKYSSIPTFSVENNVNCIIEIPAGTNKKIEQDKVSLAFEVDQRDGKDRHIEYLPYPANYGFIASTFSPLEIGGDGDPLDVLVLCEALPTGTVIETIPIGMLKLLDNDEQDYKIICIPADEKLRTMSAVTFAEFNSKYPIALQIIELWFSNYDPIDSAIIEGWGDEKEALAEIKRTAIPF